MCRCGSGVRVLVKWSGLRLCVCLKKALVVLRVESKFAGSGLLLSEGLHAGVHLSGKALRRP
jgi:hypothetical protein